MSAPTQTQATWAIDNSHSSVEFSVKHMMFTTARGRFGKVEGTIVADEANPANSSVKVTIDGREWDVYEPGDAGAKQNVTYAIGTQAGSDYVLLYGSRSADSTAELAASLTSQIDSLSEAE